MKKIIITCFLLAVHINTLNASPYQKIDTLLKAILEKTKVAGVSIAINLDEKNIYTQAFGYADVDNKIKLTTTAPMRTASVAKIITATAIGRLVSLEILDFDKPIINYIPNIANEFATITIRQLAGHTSGLPHRPVNEILTRKHYSYAQETLNLFNGVKLLSKPGEKYSYSSNGYNLLAIIIENVSGMSYIDYMQNEIFKPLKMHNTFAEDINQLTSSDSKLYYFNEGELTLDTQLVDGSYKLAGAGFRSTANDLASLMNAYSNGFIKKVVVNDMFKSNQLINEKKTNVGIGWRNSFDVMGRTTVDHAGNWQGARTVVMHYLQEKLTTVIMINTQSTILIEEMAQIIAQTILNPLNTSGPFDKEINQNINMDFTSSSGVKKTYDGTIIIDLEGNGQLNINAQDRKYLQSMPIIYLGNETHFALVSQFGLLYLKFSNQPYTDANVYFYQSRLSKIPTLYPPMLTFNLKRKSS
jgi:CubicO group peptidase (beta-lactamase class C family)